MSYRLPDEDSLIQRSSEQQREELAAESFRQAVRSHRWRPLRRRSLLEAQNLRKLIWLAAVLAGTPTGCVLGHASVEWTGANVGDLAGGMASLFYTLAGGVVGLVGSALLVALLARSRA